MSSEPERKRVKRLVPFLEAHEYMYGVRVVERDPVSREVTSVLCMFCAAFGREDDPLPSLRRRARTQKPKYWGGPTFRTDNYKSHFKKQHPIRWEQYQDLPPEQKQRYFDGVPALPKKQEKPRRSLDNEQVAVKTAPLRPPIVTPSEPEIAVSDATILAPASPEPATVSSTQSPVAVAVTSVVQAPAAASVELDEGEVLAFLLDRDAVEVALGDVLFRAEDAVNGVGKQLAVFESTLDERDRLDQQKSDGTAEVRVLVRSVKLFHRVVELLAVGLTFDQTAEICQTQMSTGIRDRTFVPHIARVAVGANLQALGRILQRGWAFSLSLHSVDRRRPGEKEPHMFLDVRVRVYCTGKIKSFHLLSLPVETEGDPSSTGEIMLDTLSTFLQAVHKRWLRKVIGCCSEVTSSEVSAVALSLARRIEQQALPGFVRVSSAWPPLDALMQHFFDSVLFADDAEWHLHLTSLVAYLQRQMATGNTEELSAASVTTCPRVGEKTWWKLTEVARWFDNARVPIQRLLARRNASVAPPPTWWLNLKVALVVGSIAIKARWGLEGGYATLMSQQPQRISMLRLALAGDLGVEGPLPAYQRAALRDQSSLGEMIGSNDGMFAVKPHTIVAFVRGMGNWAAELFDELDAQERQKMIVSTADRTLDLVQGLHSLAEELEEHGSSKTSLSAFPPVLPHQVALLNPVDFQEIVRVYRPRVTETFSDAKLAAVETQHQELRTAASEAATRQLLAKSAENSASSFNQSWEALRARWGLLADFCGGLATVFPSSNGGSSGKTFVAVDATGSQRKLADFPLEARLQCQQFAELHANSDDDFRDGIQ
ncbi:hypothetical protein PC128_g232 [Phytophthora cactorum]|nr:hypothetical protein PC120_g1119 [Phytophthora cactorum]KAG3096530.1 hypothetical protein PC121_g2483 [Phytophthora cactorum]KAG3207254.1 hypothetical protein PC128_g232 [Phytophthora cactorum]KAG4064425.1 hypothetical protein PC123_g738 [Phytophthora cactorum]